MNGIPSTPTPAPRPVAARLRHRVSASIPIASGSSGPPLVEPRSEDEVAAVLTTAADEGWRVSPVGRGTWRNGAVGADMEVSTARLTDIVSVDAGDLVATVQAGVDLATLTERLSTHGVWLAVDPPGTRRSVGSVLSTATAGPLCPLNLVGVLPVVAVKVIFPALIRVGEHFVGRVDLLEAFFSHLVVGVHVRVIFARQTAKSRANVLLAGVALYSENVVEVLGHYLEPFS